MTTTTTPAAQGRPRNRLAQEKSPYLLQHAHNPVDWFAWGEDAFEKARRENKPIFLSIGYSTCHWCHVMERESFENDSIADLLNRYFISIKVDREERPDVDRIYMLFVQATTGQGGWPLNVFLTPDLKPFYGGTYFPADDRMGQRGFSGLLRQIHELWDNRNADLTTSADEIHSRLQQLVNAQNVAPKRALDAATLRNAGQAFKRTYDPVHGGFGVAPKFPQPSQPRFLLRYAKRFKDPEAVAMVLHTCDRMSAGGIHDHLGGGFARYSVDAEWKVPHFEKMLYDNAQLADLYLDAVLVSKELSSNSAASNAKAEDPNPKAETRNSHSAADYAAVARGILDYVLRDMTDPEGGFYSAEDADSEGHEGKFYCWTRAELEQLLAPREFAVASRCFGISDSGNFRDHSHPNPLPGQNVLNIVDPALSEAERPLLESARAKLYAARNQRVRPHRDDKILASWNGLMLGAFARGSIVLGEKRYREAAEKNLRFIRQKLWVSPAGDAKGPDAASTGTLYHRWREGARDEVQLLEGYAFLLGGVLELYESTLEQDYLEFAIALAEAMLARFYDARHGGFWQTQAGARDLILRAKQEFDGAEPSGVSVATLALLRLGAITDRKPFIEAAEKTLLWLSNRLHETPQAVPYLLQALDFSMEAPRHIVVAGNLRSAPGDELLKAIHSVYQPNKVVLGSTGAVDAFSRSLPAADGPVVYLCAGTSCRAPTQDPAQVIELLR